MAYLDFESIKAAHAIETVAVALGLELEQRGNQLRCKCPVGGGDERSFVITPSKGLFFSFTEQKGGDLISLVSFVKGIGTKEAAQWIVEHFSQEETKVQDAPSEAESKPDGLPPLDYLVFDHPAVEALEFDPEEAEQLGIGFAPRGLMKGTVAVPIRLASGRLVGYIGITDARLPKQWKL